LVLTTGLTFGTTALADGENAKAAEKTEQTPSPSGAKKAGAKKAKSGDADKSDEAKKAKSADAKGGGGEEGEDGEKQVAQAGQSRQAQLTAQRKTPDEGVDEEERLAPPRVPWRGSAVNWSHTATASALGIGDDYQGDDFQTYTQTFGANFNYYLVSEDRWALRTSTAPSFTTELTDSATTTTRNEPQFNDLNWTVVLSSTWYQDKDANYAMGGTGNITHLFPTSPQSQANGTIVTLSPRFLHWHSIPLLPKDVSPVFNSVFVGASIRWDHRFGLATTAVNSNLRQPRQDASGNPLDGDQLTGARITQDTLREGFFLFFQDALGPTTLQYFVSWSFNQQFRPEFGGSPNSDCVVNLDTGCVPEGQTRNDQVLGDTPEVQYGYGFGAGVTFFPMVEWGVSLSYSNQTNSLGPDGLRQSIFYSPQGAQFSAGLVLSLDAIYERVTGPTRNTPLVLFGKNDTKKKRKNDKRKVPTGPVTF
jgi:hypothetical protein